MTKIFQVFAIFIATILFLSIELNERPIFSHIYKVISPATKWGQQKTENFFNSSVATTQSFSRKLFDNSDPKMKDSVKSKMASPRKSSPEVAEPAERITEEEKEQLDDLIKSHH